MSQVIGVSVLIILGILFTGFLGFGIYCLYEESYAIGGVFTFLGISLLGWYAFSENGSIARRFLTRGEIQYATMYMGPKSHTQKQIRRLSTRNIGEGRRFGAQLKDILTEQEKIKFQTRVANKIAKREAKLAKKEARIAQRRASSAGASLEQELVQL